MTDFQKKLLYKVALGVCALALIIASFLLFRTQSKSEVKAKKQKLLIILIDGMRYDYASRDSGLKGFPKMMDNGVHPAYVDPIFPSNSYPNWYAIATGMYGENHGMVQNYMYDPLYNEFYQMEHHPNYSHPLWWNQSEPIWVQAEKAGHKTSMYYWSGCAVNIRNVLPSRCLGYQSFSDSQSANQETESKLETILEDFKNNKFDLSMLYYEQVDHNGHKRGPSANETFQAVRDIDNILDKFLNRIKEEKMDDVVNVYIVSDHGMSKPENLLNIEQLINMKDVKYMIDSGSFFMILPENKEAEDRIYNDIKTKANGILYVYRKAEIPDELHIKNNRRTLDLVVRATPGHVVTMPKIDGKTYPNKGPFSLTPGKSNYNPGFHGYFSKEFDQMRAIMFAIGPAFKKGLKAGPIEQVDHYQIFCHILNMDCNAHDGKWERVKEMLA